MNKHGKHSPTGLAARREALLAECALQRVTAAQDMRAIWAPVHNARDKVGGNFAIPVSVAGIVLGVLANRRKKLVPMLTTAFSVWKLAQNVLHTWRHRNNEQPGGMV